MAEQEIVKHDEFTVLGHLVAVTTGKEDGFYYSEIAMDDDDQAMQKKSETLEAALAAHAEGVRMVGEMKERYGL